MSEVQNLLRFDPQTKTLSNGQGFCVLLDVLLKTPSDQLPSLFSKPQELFTKVQWSDLLCRLPKPLWPGIFETVSSLCENEAEWTFLIPHPRHDQFLVELDYISAHLPKTLLQIERQNVRLEHLETAILLDPSWQQAVTDGEITYESIDQISAQACNVIQSYQLKTKLHQSRWQALGDKEQVSTSHLLTEDMRKQLSQQYQAALEKGEHERAALIANVLNQTGIPK